ncbi:MAG: hypothetical protein GY793_07015 [Proteobacteria bacterium]|nr:hypothetical protein [Pseudomonadota bacterium]
MKKDNIVDRRNFTDRRKRKSKDYQKNGRRDIRRDEDKKNLITYYAVLALTLFVLGAFGVVSFCYSY